MSDSKQKSLRLAAQTAERIRNGLKTNTLTLTQVQSLTGMSIPIFKSVPDFTALSEVVRRRLEPLHKLTSRTSWQTCPVLQAAFHPPSLLPSLAISIPRMLMALRPCSFSLGRLCGCPSDPV